jgi:hypothetical protein
MAQFLPEFAFETLLKVQILIKTRRKNRYSTASSNNATLTLIDEKIRMVL